MTSPDPLENLVLSKGHEVRNLAEYEGADEVDEDLVHEIIDAAKAVRTALRSALKR